MRKPPAKTAPVDPEDEAEVGTAEATLLWVKKDALVAVCGKGIVYTWETRPKDGLKPGDMVLVIFDKETGTVYSINPSC